MVFAKSGDIQGVNPQSYSSLIHSIEKAECFSPDVRADSECSKPSIMHYELEDGSLRFGLGFSRGRLCYWIFGDEEGKVSQLSEVIQGAVSKSDPRRN